MSEQWKSMLVGRERELARLEELWLKARAGEPQFAVILAESGLGKTRLVQAFYELLATKYDPSKGDGHGYWPDLFGGDTPISPEINPVMPAGAHAVDMKIPWLWWGLRARCTDPDVTRRGHAGTACALTDAMYLLAAHKAAIGATQAERQARLDDVARQVAKAGVKALGNAAGVGLFVELYEAFVAIRAAARPDDTPGMRFDEAVNDYRESVADEAARLLCSAMGRAADGGADIPVVVVLDDAQWADAESVRFLDIVMSAAVRERLPLMVIATHWEREWNLHMLEPRVEPPVRLAHLTGLTPEPIVLKPVQHLHELLADALPGLTHDQSRMIAEKVGGNPLLMVELINELRSNTRNFVNRDLSGALTPAREREIRLEQLDLFNIFRRRIANLDEGMKDDLARSSVQGLNFLKGLTVEVARRMCGQADVPDDIDALVGRHIDDAAVVHAILNRRTQDAMEFRQAAYFEAIRGLMGADEIDEVREILKDVVRDRIQAIPDAGMDEHERGLLLEFAVNLYSWPRGTTPSQADVDTWFAAAYMLFTKLKDDRNWSGALAVAMKCAGALKDSDVHPSLDTVLRQIALGRFLLDFLQIEPARELFDGLRTWLVQSGASDLRVYSVVIVECGRCALRLKDNESARSWFQQALELDRKIVEKYGETYESQRDISIDYGTLGDVALRLLDNESARSWFQQALDLDRRIAEEYGETSESLRGISIDLGRLGDVALRLRDNESARSWFQQALELKKKIVEKYGETPESLRGISISLRRLGDAALRFQDNESASSCFQQAYELGRKIVETYGETPESLRDLTVYLVRLGDVALRLQDNESARSWFQQALELGREIVEKYGETPESQRDVSVYLGRLGDVALRLKDNESARSWFQQALELDRKVAEKYGETPESLRDISIDYGRLGDVALRLKDKESARSWFQQALELGREIVQKYGETPESLEDVSMHLRKLESLMPRNNDNDATHKKLQGTHKNPKAFDRRLAAVADTASPKDDSLVSTKAGFHRISNAEVPPDVS